MSIRSTFFLPFFLIMILCKPGITLAQQMIVDDATIAQQHIFEAWAGTEESWIQPNLSFSPSWNVNPGIIFKTSNQEIDPANWLIENKLVATGIRWAYGNVSAVVFDFDGKLSQIYSYLPVSRTIFNYNSFIHLNLGIELNHLEDEWEYYVFYGLRGDFSLTNRTILLTVYSTPSDSIGFQAGLRFILIPAQLESDITYGQSFDGTIKHPGFNVGVTFAM